MTSVVEIWIVTGFVWVAILLLAAVPLSASVLAHQRASFRRDVSFEVQPWVPPLLVGLLVFVITFSIGLGLLVSLLVVLFTDGRFRSTET